MFDLKPRAVVRGLEMYLLALLGGLAAAAIMIAAPAFDVAIVKRDAELRPLSPASADAAIPERPAEPGQGPTEAPVVAARADAGGIAGVRAVRDAAVMAMAAAISSWGQIWSAGTVSAGRDRVPDLRAMATPHGSVAISYSLPDPLRARRPVKGGIAPIVGYPLPRSRHSRSLTAARLSAEAGPPALRGAAGSGCPAGSDPRWREPGATRSPVLICNPYYRRLSLDAF